VTVSEKSGKPMTYTLAIVDDGLLDLTNFKTPDPWNEISSCVLNTRGRVDNSMSGVRTNAVFSAFP